MDNALLFGTVDVAEIVTILFVVFFFGLVVYLRREDRREGYPLEADSTGKLEPTGGFLTLARAKTFILPHGHGTVSAPSMKRDTPRAGLKRTAVWPGAPSDPTGDPLADGVGPASYAERAKRADIMHDGSPKIRPLRDTPDFKIARGDRDPRGLTVFGADGKIAGTVADVWVDRMEQMIRYLEVKLADGSRTVIMPMPMCVVKSPRQGVHCDAIAADLFKGVPALENPGQITLFEEDRISGYFGGGYLYGLPGRAEPIV